VRAKIKEDTMHVRARKAHANDGGDHTGDRGNGLQEDCTVEDLVFGDRSEIP
jgi:hypothetical protein